MRKKFFAIALTLTMTFSMLNVHIGKVVKAADREETEIELSTNETNSLLTETSQIDDNENTATENELVVIKDCIVTYNAVNINDSIADINVTISNLGNDIISKWYLVYNSSAHIENLNNAEIIMDKDVHYLKYSTNNEIIPANNEITFSMTISFEDAYVQPNDFRIYGQRSEECIKKGESYFECNDTISYDLNNQTYELNISETEPVEPNIWKEIPQISPAEIIGTDDRTLVTNVTSSPYIKIAALVTTWEDGTTSLSTGYMISNRYMLTAAHCVFSEKKKTPAKMVRAFFGRNGSTYSYSYYSSRIYWSSAYASGDINSGTDWGVIEFNEDVGSKTGWFGVGVANDAQIYHATFTVTGFPGDKAIPDSTAPDECRRYMYTSSSMLNSVEDEFFRLLADTKSGQSGSPLYIDNGSNIAYGIYNRSSSTCNYCKRISSSFLNTIINNGWASY